jgi:hypothetical protein
MAGGRRHQLVEGGLHDRKTLGCFFLIRAGIDRRVVIVGRGAGRRALRNERYGTITKSKGDARASLVASETEMKLLKACQEGTTPVLSGPVRQSPALRSREVVHHNGPFKPLTSVCADSGDRRGAARLGGHSTLSSL